MLWQTRLGTAVQGFPISYAIDGKQYVAVLAGCASSTVERFAGAWPGLRGGEEWPVPEALKAPSSAPK